jgi:hypothetical protein
MFPGFPFGGKKLKRAFRQFEPFARRCGLERVPGDLNGAGSLLAIGCGQSLSAVRALKRKVRRPFGSLHVWQKESPF